VFVGVVLCYRERERENDREKLRERERKRAKKIAIEKARVRGNESEGGSKGRRQ